MLNPFLRCRFEMDWTLGKQGVLQKTRRSHKTYSAQE
jgi:hypothetical protein